MKVHILGASHPTAKYLFKILKPKFKVFLYTSQLYDYEKNIYEYNMIFKNCLSEDIIVSISPIHKILNYVDGLLHKKIFPKKIIFISSSSIHSKIKTNSIDKELFIHFQKSEENIKIIYDKFEKRTDFTVLRPTMLWGNGYDKNINFIYKFINKYKFFPVSSNSQGLRSPIHFSDLANLLSKLINVNVKGYKTFDVTGDEDIPFINLVELIKINSKSSNFLLIIKVPNSLIKLSIKILDLLPTNKILSQLYYLIGFLSRQSIDLIYRYQDIKSLIPKYTTYSFKEHLNKEYN